MGIIAAGQITVVDLSDAPVLNTFITASRPTTQTYSKDSRTYKPSYASTPQVLTLKVTKAGSTANIIDSISSLHWFVVDGPIKTEITSKDNSANEYISGTHNEILTTKLDIDLNKGSKRYEVMGIWPDPSTGLDVQFGGYIDLLLTQNGATGPQGPQGNTGNGIANTVITYGLSMSDTTEPATWSSERPALVKGMYLWVRTVIIYTNGSSTTSYQISYIAKDADATAEIDKAKQELLEKLETVRDESLEAVDEAKQQLVTVRDESLAAAEEAKQGLINVNTKVDNAKEELTQAKQDLANVASELNTAKQDLTDSVTAVNTKVDNAKAELTQAKQQLTTVADDLSKAKTDFQNAVSAVDTKATNLKNDLTQAKQDLASQAQQLQEQAGAQSELTNRVSSVEKTANGTKTTVSELNKTVAQNGKDITSVTARTKVVEDDLAGTKTTLSQVKTTADSTSQKTAMLESGLDGLTAKFNSMSVGGSNLFKGSRDFSGTGWVNNSNGVYAEDYQGVKIFKTQDRWSGRSQYFEVKAGEEYVFSAYVKSSAKTDIVGFHLTHSQKQPQAQGLVGIESADTLESVRFNLADEYQRIVIKIKITSSGWIMPRLERFNNDAYLFFGGYKFERGNVATDYSPSEVDLEQKVAEYKQSADQNYASLQTTVQNLDGTVQHNKTVADQTAQGFTTRIESLETYKDGESERANAYFESAKTETAKQLTAERTAIANNYVAKSTYTSDVTGIRNELSATTSTANATKTNLANYQASNDKMVASLKSSLQTTDGNVSNLQTKVEAVPGQITSAVSAVEGKIPTSVGAVNLFKGSRDFSGSWVNGGAGVYAEDYKGVKIFKKQTMWGGRSQYFEVKTGEEYVFSAYVKSSAKTDGVNFYLVHPDKQPQAGGVVSFGSTNSPNDVNIGLTDEYKRIAVKIKITKDGWIAPRIERYNTDAYLFFGGYKLERGNVATDWTPAPEDTVSQISSLSSQIQQTADGMTLLATKTELNSAKNELQSGINTATNKANAAQNTANNNAQTISTHTTQISALNTGLQAKVSQTDFNMLSGRVTTAENNITAKANELSSKITSVEGKIPTSSGGRNLAQGTSKDWSKPFTGFSGVQNTTIGLHRVLTDGLSVGDTIKTRIVLKYTDIRPASGKTAEVWMQGAGNVTEWNSGAYPGGGNGGRRPLSGSGETVFELTDKISANHLKNSYWNWQLRTDWVASGSLQWKLAKVERGMFFTDWSPAPEDTATQISNLSSEIKQTADGMTLLATKTELNTAKNELQSGINTATNKANNAQNKANNNAQTISTHTTQISALNTGLQAKVSQTEFNTLSGRVTTAENNITAKANELSSKITSVEGAIEDTQSDITKLSSEIKQTADGMTLLATKTELNSAKNDLQSGINTATNKANTAQNTANSAQSTANNNAQTISTHTTQISALNTGLQAKVSQTDFNTLSGRVTSAENNIIAKANELSSKITSVEGKIPTNIGSVNLFKGSRDFSGSWMNAGGSVYAEDYKGVKIFKKQSVWGGLSQYFEVKTGEEYVFSAYVRSSAKTDGVNFYLVHESKQPMATGLVSFGSVSGQNTIYFDLTDKYKRIAIKIKITKDGWIAPRLERGNTNAYLFFGGYKLERGTVATDWSPAPEDAINQINAVSSELKQTKDGITLLATKTELNSAKNELQSGINTATNKANSAQNTANSAQSTANNNAQTINTHTTQISALNTGLQAKVSQSEFNTLSGRVTSAENNITAKANELSSKITSVEGKIPTSVGSTNLLLYSADPWKAPSDYYQFSDVTKTDKTLNGSVVYKTNTAWASLRLNLGKQLIDRRIVKIGEEFTYSVWMRTDQIPMKVRLFARYSGQSNAEALGGDITLTNDWQKFSVTFKITQKMVTSQTKLSWVGFEQTTNSENGKFVYYACNKLERGNIATDYSPAPEDAINQISSLSSELKQTKDGITLLATKTELNTAKNDLQSGINTATNKANSNAQTINTHTTQISALNTGLQAKVSQTDFNTLSGRVTNAENNITAKANELSSKITSVEGKLPTSVGAVNLFKGSRDFSGSWMNAGGSVYAEDYKGVKIFKKQSVWGGLSQYFEVKTGEEYVFSAYVRSSAKTDGVNFYLVHESKQPMATGRVEFGSDNRQNDVNIGLTDKYKRIAIKIKITKDGWIAPRIERYNSDHYLLFGGYKLERGNVPSDWSPAPEDYDSKLAAAQSEFKQTTDSIKASVSSLDKSTIKSSSLTINSDGIVMKAGKSTTDVANAIGSYFAVNQNAIDLFADKIKVKGNMIVAGSLTADMIAGGQLRSKNGATVFDLNGGTLAFNNNYGYIQRVAGDKIFEITTYLGKSLGDSQDFLTSDFTIRKSDNSRRAGIQFQLYNTLEDKPTATAKVNADSLVLYDSKNTRLFSVEGRSAYLGSFNTQGWGDIPVANIHGGLIVKDIGIGGHMKSLLKIVEELCNKTGTMWV